MAITFVNSTTASFSASQTVSVAVPSGAANGDRLIAVLSYASPVENAHTIPSGWTEVGTAAYTASGFISICTRIMATGVTTAQWTVGAEADGVYGKSALAMAVYRGDDAITAGTPVSLSAVGTSIVAPSVTTTEADELVLAIYGERVSSQTSVTVPGTMTTRAQFINTGGGGTSVTIADEARPTTGATGTRTATLGVATNNGYGILIRLSPAGSTAPVVNAGADVASPINTAFSRTATATDADGTISSRLWTKESGPSVTISGSTTATMSVTPTTAGTYVFRHTATDNSSTTGFDEFTLYVTDTTARPSGTVTNPGGYVDVGGAGSVFAAEADESDATYSESPDASVGAQVTFSFPPLAAGAVTYSFKARASTTPVMTVRHELMSGATVIATWDDTLTTSFVTYTHTTTTAETSAITNFNDLRIRRTWQS